LVNALGYETFIAFNHIIKPLLVSMGRPASKPAQKTAKAAAPAAAAAAAAAGSTKKQPLGKKQKKVASSSDDDSDVELHSNSSGESASDAGSDAAVKQKPAAKGKRAAKNQQASDSDEDDAGAAAAPKEKPKGKAGGKKAGAKKAGGKKAVKKEDDSDDDAGEELWEDGKVAPLDWRPDKEYKSRAMTGSGKEYKKNPIVVFDVLPGDFQKMKQKEWGIFAFRDQAQARHGTNVDPSEAQYLSDDRSNKLVALFWSRVNDHGVREDLTWNRVRVLGIKRRAAEYNNAHVPEGLHTALLLVRWADATTGAMMPRKNYLPFSGKPVAWVSSEFVLCK
jgi:hypothetical protein